MKTIRSKDRRRAAYVSNEEAAKYVETGDWHYVPRSVMQRFRNRYRKGQRQRHARASLIFCSEASPHVVCLQWYVRPT
jgi:hypothetical protein